MAEIRGLNPRKTYISGLNELQSQFNKVAKFPKKELTKSAKAGMKGPLAEAKAKAPVGKKTKTRGSLKKSIKSKMETPNKRNKTIYRLTYDAKFTPVFRKKTTGKYGSKHPYAYYPFSVNYGYLGKKGHVKPKTMYWVEKILEKNEQESLQKVVNSLNDSLTQLLK